MYVIMKWSIFNTVVTKLISRNHFGKANRSASNGGSRIFLRGAPTPKVGVLTYFLPKTAWKWKNLDPGGGVPGIPPLRSTNENNQTEHQNRVLLSGYLWLICLNIKKWRTRRLAARSHVPQLPIVHWSVRHWAPLKLQITLKSLEFASSHDIIN